MAFVASKQRVAKNTLFLYFRTLLMMVIGIFTSRITLQALGVDNYGVVNVVAGFVAMFSLINASLTGACQRFITFEMGAPEGDVRSVFSASVYIHLALALIIVLLAETAGLYFVNHELNLPENEMGAVQWVYQCSIITFALNLINIPYNSIIIAHERMKVFAYISLLEAFLKLGVVLALLYIDFNKLIVYALLGLGSSIIVTSTYNIYCRRAFKDVVKIYKKINKPLSKKIFGFAGWTFIGNAATIFSNQGVNVVLNIFCGVALNAARGITLMVESTITSFINNFTTAINPQITKTYASSDKEQLLELVHLGMRISFFLMLIISVPIIVVAPNLLSVWFTEVPPYTSIFVRLTLCIVTIQALGNSFLTVMLATGKVRNYQLIVGTVTFLNFPLSYLVLKLGLSPVYIYVVALLIVTTTFSIRLYFVRNYAEIPILPALKIIISRFFILSIVAVGIGFGFSKVIIVSNFWNLGAYLCSVALLIAGEVYLIGLNKGERQRISSYIKSKIPNRMKILV